MTDGGYTQTEAWNLQLQAKVDAAEKRALEAERRAEEAERENKRLREVLADANNKWRHEFTAAVEQAADKLFARLSWQHTVKQSPAMAERVK